MSEFVFPERSGYMTEINYAGCLSNSTRYSKINYSAFSGMICTSTLYNIAVIVVLACALAYDAVFEGSAILFKHALLKHVVQQCRHRRVGYCFGL